MDQITNEEMIGSANRIESAVLIDMGAQEKIIVVIGLSGAGKSTVAKLLAQKFGAHLISTDSYLGYGNYGSINALSNLTRDILYLAENPQHKIIVEGSLCYRLLKHGAEHNYFMPHIIVNVVATEQERARRRPDKDYGKTDGMYRKMWADYLYHVGYGSGSLPRIVELANGGFIKPEYK